ncbi:unnamed protein product, partial [Anisakis simplex]|uniref:Uncharacterized protein n=1 Tax=Anisakis simplex TaxID=6269 RepID=A0A0M3JPH4_ANISI
MDTFPCYMDSATEAYLNTPEVRRAIHVPSGVGRWQACNREMRMDYTRDTPDTSGLFRLIGAFRYPL